MALIKKTTWKGFDPEYWFIVAIIQDVQQKKTSVGLGLYKDQATRNIDKAKEVDDWANMIGRQDIDQGIGALVVEGIGHPVADLYAAFRANVPFFADAIDG